MVPEGGHYIGGDVAFVGGSCGDHSVKVYFSTGKTTIACNGAGCVICSALRHTLSFAPVPVEQEPTVGVICRVCRGRREVQGPMKHGKAQWIPCRACSGKMNNRAGRRAHMKKDR